MREYRDDQGVHRVWHTRDALLLCIGHGGGNEKLVRIASRLAARLGCIWHAVYVETRACTVCPKANGGRFCAR
ncbi:Sensor protein KdpD [Ewingella americana]|uniref:Sensor protein KdpD n=1 Tax=Ewingella americana TaxID=41202 RepID=A0A377NG31_9GAMM|nr:Sensor protein KdpD [Ewingella americana]